MMQQAWKPFYKIYLLKTETFWNKGVNRSGSSTTIGACLISFLAYASASFGDKDQMYLWKYRHEGKTIGNNSLC